MRHGARSLVVGAAVLIAALSLADARMMVRDFGPPRVDFRMEERPIAGPAGQVAAQPAFLAGSTVAALGDGALVIDGDSGYLVRTDRDGNPTDRLAIGADAAQLVVDPLNQRAMVSNRMRDRVEIVTLVADKLRRITTIATHTEPYGLALTPDHARLLVTTVADPRLTAYDTVTGAAVWSLELPPEPRGVALAADGSTAIVTFLNTAAVARVELAGDQARLGFDALGSALRQDVGVQPQAAGHVDREVGQRHARAAFAASFLGSDLAVVAHQTSGPKLASDGAEQRNTYGGGDARSMPVDHRITFLGRTRSETASRITSAQAVIGVHQPRALAFDGAAGTLYVAGYGSDELMAIHDAARPGVRLGWKTRLTAAGPCGPTGIAVAGQDVWVYCALARRVVRTRGGGQPVVGGELAPSRLSLAAQRGRDSFRRGDDRSISGHGLLACSSCHPEGRADSLSWRIGGKALQTPILAARLAGTHPFKWDGGDPTLEASLRNTVTRLGGGGITVETARDLEAYLASLPRPRTARVTRADKASVARGKKLFRSREVGCASCHSGPRLTDGKKHDLAMDLEGVDTPSLIGLAVSAPYYHDGSAATLRAVLREQGTIHSMGKTGQLDERQLADLIAYLETL